MGVETESTDAPTQIPTQEPTQLPEPIPVPVVATMPTMIPTTMPQLNIGQLLNPQQLINMVNATLDMQIIEPIITGTDLINQLNNFTNIINNTTLEQENTNNDSIENSDNDDSDDSINNGENNNIVNDTIEQPMLVNNQEPEIPLNNLENIFLTALQNTELYMDYNELLQMQSILMQDFNNN